MEERTAAALERLTVSGLVKCLARLAKVSAGTWRIRGVTVSRGTMEDAVAQHDFARQGAAVYFHVKSRLPFTALMLFDLEDMELISKCFLGYSFPKAPTFTQPEEVLLMELGNIVVNSFINAVLNAQKDSCMPPVPRCADGNALAVAAQVGSGTDPAREYAVVTAALVMQSGGRESVTEVIGLLTPELEQALEKAAGQAG